MLISGQTDMDTATRGNSTMKLDAESAGGAVPERTQRRVDQVSTSWVAVQSLAMLLQCPSGPFHKQPGLQNYVQLDQGQSRSLIGFNPLTPTVAISVFGTAIKHPVLPDRVKPFICNF